MAYSSTRSSPSAKHQAILDRRRAGESPESIAESLGLKVGTITDIIHFWEPSLSRREGRKPGDAYPQKPCNCQNRIRRHGGAKPKPGATHFSDCPVYQCRAKRESRKRKNA